MHRKMNILDGVGQPSPSKKQKCNKTNQGGNTNEGGSIVKNKCTVINIIGSTVCSEGYALRLVGVAREDNKGKEKVLKYEYILYVVVL